MKLTLLRHVIAQIRDGIMLDAERKLTSKGVQRTQQALIGLATCCMDVDVILTSPKLRALQTAQMASEILDVSVHVENSLAQEDLLAIIKTLEMHPVDHVMIVGHEPTFTQLAQYLCTSQNATDVISPMMVLKKSGAMQLELERTCAGHLRRPGCLLWLLQPSILRVLGRQAK